MIFFNYFDLKKDNNATSKSAFAEGEVLVSKLVKENDTSKGINADATKKLRIKRNSIF